MVLKTSSESSKRRNADPARTSIGQHESMDWKFPFNPYQIQEDFMENLCECIEHSKIGIFSSPTGTVGAIIGVGG